MIKKLGMPLEVRTFVVSTITDTVLVPVSLVVDLFAPVTYAKRYTYQAMTDTRVYTSQDMTNVPIGRIKQE